MVFYEGDLESSIAIGFFTAKLNDRLTIINANDSFYSLFETLKCEDGKAGELASLKESMTIEDQEYVSSEIRKNLIGNKENFELLFTSESEKGNPKSYLTKCHLNRKERLFSGMVIEVTETHEYRTGRQKEEIERTKEASLKMAYRDELSGVLNRRGFIAEFVDVLKKESKSNHAFLLIDIDDFKKINDSHGHVFGDEVLTNMAFNMMSALFKGNNVGRLGGDEFVVLLKNVESKEKVEIWAREIMDNLNVHINEGKPVTVSMGISLYPEDGKDFSELYKAADQALYKAKRRGKNRFMFYSCDMGGKAIDPDFFGGAKETDNLKPFLSDKMLKSLMDTAPGGIAIFEAVRGKVVTRFINNEFLNFMEITRPNFEMLYKDDFEKTVESESWKILTDMAFKAKRNTDGSPVEFEYKLSFSLSEKPVWLHGRMEYIPRIERRGLYLVMVNDISRQKEEEKLRLGSEKTYIWALERAGIRNWNYDFAGKTFLIKEGRSFVGIESFLESAHIHKDSRAALYRLYDSMERGVPEGEEILRGRAFGSGYHWFKSSYKTIFSEEGRPVKTLGITEKLSLGQGSKPRLALEEWIFSHVTDKGMAAIKNNLSRNVYLECKNFNGCDKIVTYDDFINYMSSIIYDEKDSGFSLETGRLPLMESFVAGEDYKRHTFLMKGNEGKLKWATFFSRVLMDPETGDLLCYSYIKEDKERLKRELEVKEPVDRDLITTLYTEEFLIKALKKDRSSENLARGLMIIDLVNASYQKMSLGEGRMAELLSRWGQDLRLLLPSKYLACAKHGALFCVAINAVSDEGFYKEAKEIHQVFKNLIKFKDPDECFFFAAGAALKTEEENYKDVYKKAWTAREESIKEGNWTLAFYEEEHKELMAVPLIEKDSVLKGQIKMEAFDGEVEVEESEENVSIRGEDLNILGRTEYLNRVEVLKNEGLASLGVVAVSINMLPNFGATRSIKELDEDFLEITRFVAGELNNGEIYRIIDTEFVVVFPNYQKEFLLTRAGNVEKMLRQKFPGRTSTGYSWSGEPVDVHKMLAQCQELKRANHLRFRESVLHRTGEYHDSLLSNLITDLDKGKYQAFYQPIIWLKDNSLYGMEALARGLNEKGDIVLPSAFIDSFEEMGIIRYLDLFILEESLKALKRFKKMGYNDLKMSVNFSRETMQEPRILAKALGLVDKHEVPREDIQIEITERMGDLQESTIERVAREFKESGLNMALDDFGSQYSNFSILSKLELSTVKIDRSLIELIGKNENGETIIKSIILACKQMGLTTLAEGVSTHKQLEFLRDIGCDLAQGFYFSKALDKEKFRERFLLKDE